MFEAVQRSRRGEAVVKREHGHGKRFVCSLGINEMVLVADKSGEMRLCRVQKISMDKVICFRHHAAARIDDNSSRIFKSASTFEGKKVVVDASGRIFRAND